MGRPSLARPAAPNPYEARGRQETDAPLRRICSAFQGWRSQHPVLCFDVIAHAGADDVCLHHTRREALSPSRWRVQRTLRMVLCGRETSLCPRAVRCIDVAARDSCAREVQGQVRGRTHRPSAAIAISPGAGAGVPATRRAHGEKPRCSWAFQDAAGHAWQRARSRLLPVSSSEALGSPAPLHEPVRNVCLANVRSRLRLS
jgi:hypothetical protein